MAILNKNTSIGDITDVYERLKASNSGGGGIKTLFDPTTGDLMDIVTLSNKLDSNADFTFTGNTIDFNGINSYQGQGNRLVIVLDLEEANEYRNPGTFQPQSQYNKVTFLCVKQNFGIYSLQIICKLDELQYYNLSFSNGLYEDCYECNSVKYTNCAVTANFYEMSLNCSNEIIFDNCEFNIRESHTSSIPNSKIKKITFKNCKIKQQYEDWTINFDFDNYFTSLKEVNFIDCDIQSGIILSTMIDQQVNIIKCNFNYKDYKNNFIRQYSYLCLNSAQTDYLNCNIYIDDCIFDFTNYPYEGVINFGQDLYLNEHDSDKPFITFINNMIITAKTYANSLTPSCIFYKASKVMNPNISALDIFYCDNNTIRYKKFFDMDLFSNISKAGGVKIWT